MGCFFFSVHTKMVNILWLTPSHSVTALSSGQWSLWYIPHHLAVPIKVQQLCCEEALVVCSVTTYSWRANLSNHKVTFRKEVRRLQAIYKMPPVDFAVFYVFRTQTLKCHIESKNVFASSEKKRKGKNKIG